MLRRITGSRASNPSSTSQGRGREDFPDARSSEGVPARERQRDAGSLGSLGSREHFPYREYRKYMIMIYDRKYPSTLVRIQPGAGGRKEKEQCPGWEGSG